MIKEVIVVEGRDDLAAVKRAVDAEVIWTQGFSLNKEVIDRIKLAQKRRGVVIFTDPDKAGRWIRKRIKKEVNGCKDAYLKKSDSLKDGDIGIENASPEAIKEALDKAGVSYIESKKLFTKKDLIKAGLLKSSGAKKLRIRLGKELGIGYANGKQFLKRLNHYGIKCEEFKRALAKVKKGDIDANS